MPIIKSAKKKLKQDKKRALQNLKYRKSYKLAIYKVKKAKTGDIENLVKQAYSQIDKAVKKNVIHKNKAARLKQSVAKYLRSIKKPKVKK